MHDRLPSLSDSVNFVPDEPHRASAPRRFKWIGIIASTLLFGTSLVVLWRLVAEMQVSEVLAAFTNASAKQIGLAVFFTAVSYLLLTCYDALALRQLKLSVPYGTTMLASFTSYAVSFTLGFPVLTAGTVRYWIYAPKGLSAGRIASLTVVAGITFWLGMGLVLGTSLLLEADTVAWLLGTRSDISIAVGGGALAAVAGYLLAVSLKRRAMTIQGWRLELPGFRLSIAQMLIGAVETCAACAVLYTLLPAGSGVGFGLFLAVYVAAVMLGIVSHAPGGLGVFEATMLLALSHLPREPVLGALLLFRVCYYLVPFLLSLVLLGLYGIAMRLRKNRQSVRAPLP